MIEVEKRVLINQEKYKDLLEYWANNAEFINEEKQITTYFECEQDFRLMETDKDYIKVWLKKGKMHDDYREEVEVIIDNSQKESMKKLLKELGYKEKIKWYRIRRLYKYKGMTITMDYSVGYGYIIEIEGLVEEDSKIESINLMIDEIFTKLELNNTSKEELYNKFKDYKENWKKYTRDIKDFFNINLGG